MLKNELLLKFVGVAGVRVVNMSIVFVISILLARTLGPEQFGAFNFIMSLVGSIALLCYLGGPPLLTREVAKYYQSREQGLLKGLVMLSNKCVLLVSVVLSVGVGIISLILYLNCKEIDLRLLLLALPLIPLVAISAIRMAILKGLREVVLADLPEMTVKPIAFLLILMACFHINETPTAEQAMCSQVLASAVAFFIGALLYKSLLKSSVHGIEPKYDTKKWKSSLYPFVGMAGVSFINVEFVNLLLGFTGTNQDVSWLRVASNLAMLVALPLTLIESVVSPYITQLYQSGKYIQLQNLAQYTSLASLILSAIPAFILLLWGRDIISYVYGVEYIASYETMVLIVIGYFLVNLVGLSMQLLYATDYQMSAFRISSWGAILTVFVGGWLIVTYGAIGAGIVIGIGKAIRATLFVVEARRRLGIKSSLIW